MISKHNKILLDEIRKELEPIVKNIAEKYIKNKEEEKREKEDEEIDWPKWLRERYKYEIRAKIYNKNLDGVSLKN